MRFWTRKWLAASAKEFHEFISPTRAQEFYSNGSGCDFDFASLNQGGGAWVVYSVYHKTVVYDDSNANIPSGNVSWRTPLKVRKVQNGMLNVTFYSQPNSNLDEGGLVVRRIAVGQAHYSQRWISPKKSGVDSTRLFPAAIWNHFQIIQNGAMQSRKGGRGGQWAGCPLCDDEEKICGESGFFSAHLQTRLSSKGGCLNPS